MNSNISSQDTIIKAISNKADQAQLPVGSMYCNLTDATNPGTLLGYGTWVSLGPGRFILSAGTGTDINGEMKTFAAGATGGEYDHTLTVPEIPAHTHTIAQSNSVQYGSGGAGAQRSGAGTDTTSSTGGGGSHNNIPPYITVYAWYRTV